jgi:ERCC4-type nuclease
MTMTTTLTPTLTSRAQEIVDRVNALREYTRDSHHKTTKSQRYLINSLDGAELADALRVLKQTGSFE